jgi:hypothetical protein
MQLHQSTLLLTYHRALSSINLHTVFTGFIEKSVTNTFEMSKFVRRDHVDYEAHAADGKKVDIIAGLTFGDGNQELLIDTMKDMSSKNSSLVVKVSDTENPLDVTVTAGNSLFAVFGYFNLLLSGINTLYVVVVIRSYYRIKNGSFPINYCSAALVLTGVASVVRILRSWDFAGWRGSFPYTIARIFTTLPANLGVSCLLMVSFFWLDATTQITHGLNMKFVKPPGPCLRHCMVVLSLLALVADVLIFLLLDNIGRVSNMTAIIVLMYCGVHLALSGLIFRVTSLCSSLVCRFISQDLTPHLCHPPWLSIALYYSLYHNDPRLPNR